MERPSKKCVFNLKYLTFLFPTLLTACSSGGSFDVADVEKPSVQDSNPVVTPIKKIDDSSDVKKSNEQISDDFYKPKTGATADIPQAVTKGMWGNTVDEEKEIVIDEFFATDRNDNPKHDELQADHDYQMGKPFGNATVIQHSNDGLNESKKRNYQFTNNGFEFYETGLAHHDKTTGNKAIKGKLKGYIFYKGVNPSASLVKKETEYNGEWAFTTDAKSTRTKHKDFSGENPMNDIAGKTHGAFSYAESINKGGAITDKGKFGHTSKFVVDREKGIVTGEFVANGYCSRDCAVQEIRKRYTFEAKIVGNRFQGNVTAVDGEDTLFGQNGKIEGGFYGDKGQEIAGKFLANDKSLFGVFGAKREVVNGEELDTILDSVKINKKMTASQNLDNFGDITKLYIGGKEIDLLNNENVSVELNEKEKANVRTDKEKNWQFLRFGQFDVVSKTNEKEFEKFVFLQGERVDSSKLPTDDKTVEYAGSWNGFVSGKTNFETTKTKANFKVNFAEKTLKGTLQADDVNALSMSAKIEGNGFIGTAKTFDNGWKLDSKANSDRSEVHFDNLTVKGGFYGNAGPSELGGAVYGEKDGNKIQAVFGAKRQVEAK
ncbi:Transferrin-binding protein 2 precursor [Phocoenobacter uteri]|uniref:Transferrin-binding protein 2 n=1 Tax=Phocoenobacter uteri TaxID=146806 RepID=A0A379CCD2_9PAST|nr:transferrin-binding protein-like solute binding protein [Phocoenobacter uteri]MDG6881902.1 hypothetical protein [Phocoenobacter uteri]SUB59940.1 Transferrin-binding protein 2 precursor [Phocoenobacter uteri]